MSALLDAGLSLFMEAAASEEQGRVEVQPVVDVRGMLHEKQASFFDCDARVRNVLGGRQGGKTFGVVAWQFAGALEKPDSFNVYLALTSKSARNIVWPEVRAVALAIGLDPSCLHEHTMTVKFPNGATWQAAGTDDVRTIESWRGVKMYRVALDEMGSQPAAFVGYFVREIIWPTLIKHRGQLAQVGTPGKVPRPDDYWYQQTGPARDSTTPLYRWTAWDNPHLGGVEYVDAFVDEYLDANALTRESPAFIREWMAEWCEDAGSLVFPLGPSNVIDALPLKSPLGGVLPESGWRYAIGVDVGWVDATAIVVSASHPLDRREFIVSAENYGSQMLVTDLRDRLRLLQKQYAGAPIVLDSGGMGKYHAGELTKQWQMSIEAAEKVEKASHVRDVRDRILAGRLLLLDGPCCDPLRSEWAVLGWDAKREKPDGVDHVSDAALYAIRRLRHHVATDAQPELPPVQALAKQLRDRRIAQLRPQPGRERWDR
jgi:hypothetical protein